MTESYDDWNIDIKLILTIMLLHISIYLEISSLMFHIQFIRDIHALYTSYHGPLRLILLTWINFATIMEK